MKRNKWSVAQQIGVSLVIVTVVVGVFVTLAVRSTRDFMAAATLTSHTQEVLGLIDGILSEAKDAEAGYHAYLISGDETHLVPLTRAQESLAERLSSLRELVSDNPEQVRRSETLRTVLGQRLESLRAGVQQRRTGGSAAAQTFIEDERARAQLEAVWTAGRDMRREEERLLHQRSEQLARNSSTIEWVFQGGAVVAFLIFVTIAVVVGRGLIVSIGEAVTQVQGSSSALQTAATQQAQGAREQASATTEISTTVKELLSTSRQIASSAQQVVRVADDTSGAARSGSETVQRAQEAIDAVRRQVDSIVNHMLELGKRSQEVGGILDIINELAEQTNILAINATIESAGAGENGKRFAVVAEEIRKLADRVGSSTKDIRVLIDEIRAASNTTIMATEDGSKAVQSSANQFKDVAGSFRRIAELVHTNLDAAREIELSTQQQTTAVEQVNTAILEVAQTARQSEASSEETLRTATRLIALSKQLNALIESRASAA